MTKSRTRKSRQTKSATIIRLLSRGTGADLTALQKATDWQPHSVRAVLSTLRKAGYQIDRMAPKTEGSSAIYRITATPERACRACGFSRS